MIRDFFEHENIMDDTIEIEHDVFTEADGESFGDVAKRGLLRTTGIDADKVRDDWNDVDPDNRDDNNSKASVIANDIVPGVSNTIDKLNTIIGDNRIDNRSIVARAKNSICLFPIYITQTIRVNEAHIISKMFERIYTNYIQTAIAQNPIIDEKDVNNLGFLKSYHTNIREAAKLLINEFYEPIDEFDRMMCESLYSKWKINDRCYVEFCMLPPNFNNDLVMECSRLMNEPLKGFKYLTEAEGNKNDITTLTTVQSNNQLTKLSEDDLRNIAINEIENLTGETITPEEVKLVKQTPAQVRSDVEADTIGDRKDPSYLATVQHAYDTMINRKKAADQKVDKAVAALKDFAKLSESEKAKNPKLGPRLGRLQYSNGYYTRAENNVSTTNKEVINKPDVPPKEPIRPPVPLPSVLKDADIKKINGMLPYNVGVTFRVKTAQGTLDRDVNFIIGVKSVLHLIRSQDLQDDLRELVTGNIKSLQKVRYKTGEISFKDYLFNDKGLKADAAKNINYNKKWINTLKRLADASNGLQGTILKQPSKLINGGSTPIPNATLVLSQSDVSSMVAHTGIDIGDASTATLLARNLFLIAIAIVDSSAGTMKVLLPAESSEWDVQSLASIDAEVSKTDNSQLMRELNRVVNR